MCSSPPTFPTRAMTAGLRLRRPPARSCNRSSPPAAPRSLRPRRSVRCRTTRHPLPSWHRSTKPSSKPPNGSAGHTSSSPAGSPTNKRRRSSTRLLAEPALRRAEHDGHPMHRVLPALVDAAPLHAAENDPTQSAPAHDIAAVLHHRVTAWHDHSQPSQGGRVEPLFGGIITPAGPLGDDIPVDQRAAIEQVEALITSRIDTVTRQLVADPPTWLLRALGRPPADPRRRNT